MLFLILEIAMVCQGTWVLPLFVQQMCYKSTTHCCIAIVALQFVFLTYVLYNVTFSENQAVITVTQNVCANKSLSETAGWDESRYEEEWRDHWGIGKKEFGEPKLMVKQTILHSYRRQWLRLQLGQWQTRLEQLVTLRRPPRRTRGWRSSLERQFSLPWPGQKKKRKVPQVVVSLHKNCSWETTE